MFKYNYQSFDNITFGGMIMDKMRLVLTSLLLGVALLISLLLETRLTNYVSLELLLIVLGIIAGAFVISGIAEGRRGAWPAASVLFAALLGNFVFLFFNTKTFTLFIVALVVCVVGILLSIMSLPSSVDAHYGGKVRPYGKKRSTKKRAAKRAKKKVKKKKKKAKKKKKKKKRGRR